MELDSTIVYFIDMQNIGAVYVQINKKSNPLATSKYVGVAL